MKKTSKPESVFRRRMRLMVSALIIGFPAVGLGTSAITQNASAAVFLVLYLVFVAIVTLLLCWIAGRLYQLHQVSAPKSDIATLLLTTTLIATPLGFANLNMHFMKLMSVFDNNEDLETFGMLLTMGFYLLILPIFYMAEIVFSRIRSSE